MQANSYVSSTADPRSHDAGFWALLCMLLAIYCGLYSLSAGIVAYATHEPLMWVTSGVGALGILTWAVTGWAIRHGRQAAGGIAGAIGLMVFVVLMV